MSKSIKCTNEDGYSITFEYSFEPFFLESCEGIYKISNNVKYSQNTVIDGATYQGSVMDMRNIVINAQMCEDYKYNRSILYTCFKPKSQGTLIYTEDSEKYEIEYYVDSIDIEEEGVVRDISISLLCPEPVFKDPSYTVVLMSSWDGDFEFTHEFTEEGDNIGHRTQEQIKDISNCSTVENIGFIAVLEATGNVVNPEIKNMTTGESIKLNITLSTGDKVEIITETGNKNVYLTRDSNTSSINGYIDEDSTFFQLETGDNTIWYGADSGTEYIDITIKYRQSYMGV